MSDTAVIRFVMAQPEARTPPPQCPACGSSDRLRCGLAASDVTGGCVAVASRLGIVARRDEVLAWIRDARGSAAEFFTAAAIHFGIEDDETDSA
jgi:hypothetical protein